MKRSKLTVHRLKGGIVVKGDCIQMMKKVRPKSIDLVFADPPFNIEYQYDEYQDNKDPHEYLQWTERWIKGIDRILKSTGSVFVAIGDEYVAPVKLILDTYFTLRNWIIWHYTFGVYCQTKFGRDHAHILYYVRDPKSCTFNSDGIREPSARQLRYRDKRADSKGRVPGDVWTFPRVCGTFRERNKFGHKCQMPEGILERIIRATTKEGDCVFDPFGGTGTTAAVAKRLNRRYITSEISEAYVAGILRRLR